LAARPTQPINHEFTESSYRPLWDVPPNVPRPDPSIITSQEITKAKVELRTEYNQLLQALRDIIETRLHAIDEARTLSNVDIQRRQQITDAMLADLKAAQNASDQVVDQRAQAANDALERLLRSSIDATTSISDVRHEATQLAITKVESQLTSAFVASKAAIDAALQAANSDMESVNQKALMRSEAVHQTIKAVEDRLIERILAIKQLIDLGSDMSKEAITKAEAASEKRFSGLNELRGAMADQAASFLPRSESDARFNSISEKMDQLAGIVSTNQLDMKTMMRRDDLRPIMEDITKLRDTASVAGGKNQVWAIVGGGFLSIAAIVVALISTFHRPEPVLLQQPPVPSLTVENTKRLDDIITQNNEQNRLLNSRLDILSNRLTNGPRPTP